MKFLMIVVAVVMCSCRGGDANAFARNLDAEFTARVPPGAAKERVTSFLKSHDIKAYEDPAARTITASLPDIEKGFLVRSGVYMTFRFDENGRLKSHEIKAIATGP